MVRLSCLQDQRVTKHDESLVHTRTLNFSIMVVVLLSAFNQLYHLTFLQLPTTPTWDDFRLLSRHLRAESSNSIVITDEDGTPVEVRRPRARSLRSVSVCLSVCLFVCLFTPLFVFCLSVCLSVCLVCPFVCLIIHLCVQLSVCTFIPPPVSPSVCLLH